MAKPGRPLAVEHHLTAASTDGATTASRGSRGFTLAVRVVLTITHKQDNHHPHFILEDMRWAELGNLPK